MRVHHIEFSCQDLQSQILKFCNSFGFVVYGRWKDGLSNGKEKTVLKKDSVFFVLHEDCEAVCDYVQNVALEVENVAAICKRIPNEYILKDTTIISDVTESGKSSEHQAVSKNALNEAATVEAAILKSPVGRLQHTLIKKSNYSGLFLPNFVSLLNTDLEQSPLNWNETTKHSKMDNKNELWNQKNVYLSLDHILLAVDTGTSFKFMDWYSNFLSMSRCSVNSGEEMDGFRIETINSKGDRLGLKLTAMQYHFCSEQIMSMAHSRKDETEDVKIVFGESFHGQGPNQIDTFLKENCGPGVQHIGLLSNDIFTSVKMWSMNDVQFIKPPKHYYNEIHNKIEQIHESGLRTHLEDHGILLDIEECEEETTTLKYLLQVFTKPIFSKETFFFELIQRHGASGFGAGNISALWRAVDAYLQEQNKFR